MHIEKESDYMDEWVWNIYSKLAANGPSNLCTLVIRTRKTKNELLFSIYIEYSHVYNGHALHYCGIVSYFIGNQRSFGWKVKLRTQKRNWIKNKVFCSEI